MTRSLLRIGALCLVLAPVVCATALAGQTETPAGSFQIAQTYPAETPEFCERQYQECLAKCAKSPDNQKSPDSMTQCRAYCESVHSGCGK